MSKSAVKIVGTGSFVPEKVLSNADFEKMVDTSDEWITTRTGIADRHIVDADTASSDLAYEASKKALAEAGVGPKDLDQIIVATITPDQLFPSTACELQKRLGAEPCSAFDLSAACSGFIYGLVVASQSIQSGASKKILLVGAECLSKITDYTDRSSCILFGDGAGAVVLSESDGDCGLMHFELGADGAGGGSMVLPAGGSRIPASVKSVEDRLHYMKIAGREVYRFAVTKMTELCDRAIGELGVGWDEIKIIVPHQVNMRILEASAKRLGVEVDKFCVNIDRYGNTSAASVPIALDEAHRADRFSDSDIIMFVAFGGGLTWACAAWKW